MERLNKILQKILSVKTLELEMFLRTDQGVFHPESIDFVQGERTSHLRNDYDIFEENTFIRCSDAHLIFERTIKNISGKVQKLVEVGATLRGGCFDGYPENDFFYHVENPRIYSRMAIPIDTVRSSDMVSETEFDVLAGNKWIDAYDACERIGYSPYQPFPAILLSNYDTEKGIVHGTLSQRFFYHNYLVKHQEGIILDILSSFKSVAYREIKPGETLTDIWYLGKTDKADDLETMFEDYIRVLKTYLPPLYGSTDINRNSVVWGSWNDGINRDIDQSRLVKQAQFLSEHFPTVKWMQIDDGYSKNAGKLKIAHGLGAPYEKNGGTDLKKFPDNLKGFTEKIKKLDINPALWIGGYVPADAPLGKDKPEEWFFDYSIRPCVANGPKKLRFLDVSNPEVRDYMTSALDYFFCESGFSGMKHDFWSYAFEDSRIRLAGNKKSGYEWRSWWLKEIRKRLPTYGYLQTGCDIVMANPFLGEYFTNYRYGIDIGGGHWDHIVTNFLWGTACFALHIGDLFVPNSDSIGLLPGLTDDQALFCINYCLISRSMVEVAGWLYQHPDHPRMKWIKKALCCPNNGQDVYFADYDYRRDSTGPEVWYLKTPHFSLLEVNEILPCRTFSVFNLGDDKREFKIDMSALGLKGSKFTVTDVWNLKSVESVDTFNFKLKGRSSGLFAVNREKPKIRVLDANIKITNAETTKKGIKLSFAYPGELELALNCVPKTITHENKSLDFICKAGKGNWIINLVLPTPGVMELQV